MREDPAAELKGRIAAAQSLFVLTGAGMSAESGIATFRDAMTGLWSRFDPAQLASEEGFRADPARVWDWYAERRDGVRAALPNPGHLALGAFARRRPGVLTLVSQNVDDLHQRAGNTDTIRLHGDIQRDQWLDRCARSPACTPATRCPGARRPARAAAIWCGPVWCGSARCCRCEAIDAAERAARSCDVALIVGTSGAVWPAAGLAASARRSGAFVAIVNPHDSEIDDEAHTVLRATAALALPPLLAAD